MADLLLLTPLMSFVHYTAHVSTSVACRNQCRMLTKSIERLPSEHSGLGDLGDNVCLHVNLKHQSPLLHLPHISLF